MPTHLDEGDYFETRKGKPLGSRGLSLVWTVLLIVIVLLFLILLILIY